MDMPTTLYIDDDKSDTRGVKNGWYEVHGNGKLGSGRSQTVKIAWGTSTSGKLRFPLTISGQAKDCNPSDRAAVSIEGT